MALITFTRSEREAIVRRIQEYVAGELDQELGQFQAGALLSFFADEIGPQFYNRGLHDAQAILHKRMDEISGAIDSLEKPSAMRR